MILSQTALYALRALVHLARHGEDGPVSVDVIAEELDLPRNYLSKILHTLGRAGLLESLRGPKGGFTLARDPAETTLADVVDYFDPPDHVSRCLLGPGECKDREPCSAHERWQELRATHRRFLEDISLLDLTTTSNHTPHNSVER